MSARTLSPAEAMVPVQLTSVVPVRVYDVQGDFFDTEIDVDQPLRALQLAIEDYFHVHPDVQLVLHNRQQINADLSLRQNGCLLLKGDPYVKLLFQVKRGPLLNLICAVGREQIALAADEGLTIWEVKVLLAAELQRRHQRQDGAATPHRLRLMWRYMELNDRASLSYYRIPTNATFRVRLRREAVRGPAGRLWSQLPVEKVVCDPRTYCAPPQSQAPPPPPQQPQQPMAMAPLPHEIAVHPPQEPWGPARPMHEAELALVHQRIAQLEGTVERFYALLERTTALIPPR